MSVGLDIPEKLVWNNRSIRRRIKSYVEFHGKYFTVFFLWKLGCDVHWLPTALCHSHYDYVLLR